VLAAVCVWVGALCELLGSAGSALSGVKADREALAPAAAAGAFGRDSHSLGEFVQSRDQWPAMISRSQRLTFILAPR
jgi:hypothetical protein